MDSLWEEKRTQGALVNKNWTQIFNFFTVFKFYWTISIEIFYILFGLRKYIRSSTIVKPALHRFAAMGLTMVSYLMDSR